MYNSEGSLGHAKQGKLVDGVGGVEALVIYSGKLSKCLVSAFFIDVLGRRQQLCSEK